MTLQQLEYIVALARYRHFAQAADYCNVTQPTLSSMVQKLETELGAKLFDRSSQPIQVTAVGTAVVEQAKEVLYEARRIRELVEESRHSLSGTFTIGVLPTVAPYLLPRFLPELTARHPELDLRVVEMKTADIRQALDEGTIDAGLVAEVDGLDGYRQDELFFEEFFVYAAPDSPLLSLRTVKVSDLKDEYLWLLDEGHCFRDQMVHYCQLSSAGDSRRTYQLGSIETYMRIVEGGKGVTIIPRLAAEQLGEQQRELIRPFAIPVPVRRILLLTRKDFIREGVREELIRSIRASVPEEMLTRGVMQQLV